MRSKPKIKLEEYVAFYENPQLDLNINHLNQIINMHGFMKLHNRPKKVLHDAVSSISELLSPLRSNLQESISSSASLTIEQVKEDLATLEWQECPVQSIETVKPAEDPTAGDLRFICDASAAPFPEVSRKKRSKSRKRKSIQEVIDVHPSLPVENANAVMEIELNRVGEDKKTT